MSLNLKIEEESAVEPTIDPVTDQDKNKVIEETVNEVTENLIITSEPAPTVSEPNTVSNNRRVKIERFRNRAAKKDDATEAEELRKKMLNMTPSQRDAYLNDIASKKRLSDEDQRLKNLEIQKSHIRDKRARMIADAEWTRLSQLENGISYQKKLRDDAAEAERAIRIQKESEIRAAEAIKIAEEAKRAADLVNAEAVRFAEEARRRLKSAEAQIKEINKRAETSVDPTKWKI